MSGILAALILLASVLLILVVLVQNSKGGGLSSTFASSNQVMGVRKTTDFLEKSTWTLVTVLVVLCLASTIVSKTGSENSKKIISQEKAETAAETAPVPVEAPSLPPVE